MRAAPLFDAHNGRPLDFPGTRIVQSDAYRALMRSDEHFDLIISEPSNPWVTGVEMLYSREFLEAARQRLAPGGVHCQWLHVYEADDETVAMILRTYAAVFEGVAVWQAEGGDRLLLGLTGAPAASSIDRIAARFGQSDFAAAFAPARIRSLPVLLSYELLPLGVVHALGLPGEPHTLFHPRLSYAAARAFFTGAYGHLPSSAPLEAARTAQRNSLLQRYMARRGGRLPPGVRARMVEHVCSAARTSVCVTMLAQWRHDQPDSPARARLERELRENLPNGLGLRDLEMVDSVSRLFGSEPSSADAAVSLEEAREATTLFAAYYYQGAPFSRRALAEIWSRCQGKPGAPRGCPRARAQASAALGDLGVEVTTTASD
jgi:hypothetical protein